MQRVLTFLTVVILSLVAVACGGGNHETHGSTSDETRPSTPDETQGSTSGAETIRTIDVTMKEFAYEPASVSVKAGETVTFVFRNVGQILHDAFLGDETAQADHEHEMRNGGGHHGDGGGAVKVNSGETGELTHTFDKAGEALIIGCHEAGHYGAGMKMTVTVS